MSCRALRIVSFAFTVGLASVAGHVHAGSPGGPGEARVVVRSAPPTAARGVRHVVVDEQRRQNVRVIERTIVAPEAVVSRALAEQPVYTHLVEVQVVSTTIYVDPQRDYTRPCEPGGLDEGHFIVRAQRLHKARQAEPARVVYNELAMPAEADASTTEMPKALFIIPKPEFRERPAPGDRVQQETAPDVQPTQQRPQRVMPTVPTSPRRGAQPFDTMVRAE